MDKFAEFFASVDPAEFAAWLSQLPPRDAVLAAARVGVEIADDRYDRKRVLREWSWDVSEHFREHPAGPSFAELQRRRGLVWSAELGRWAATDRPA